MIFFSHFFEIHDLFFWFFFYSCFGKIFFFVNLKINPKQIEPNIIERNRLIERIRNETVDRLWIETYKLNVLYKENWTTMATKEIEQFQRTLIDSFKDGYWPMVYDLTGTSSTTTTTINNDDNVDNGDDQQSIEHHQQNSDDQQQQQHYQYSNHQHLYTRWSFIDSWMYSISIITTIGNELNCVFFLL